MGLQARSCRWCSVLLAAVGMAACGGIGPDGTEAGEAAALSTAARGSKAVPVVLLGAERSFGSRLALSGDLLAVGAPYETPPSVHLYARSGGKWLAAGTVRADEGSTAFGAAVALDRGTLVVGEASAPDGGRARVFERHGGDWTLVATLAPGEPEAWAFGTAVALVEDTLFVGRSCSALGGAVEVFERWGGWHRTAILAPRERFPGDFFGQTLAAAGDTLVVGAPGAPVASAVVFRRTAGAWVEEARLVEPEAEDTGYFAHHVAAARDAVLVNCACPDGEAWVFERRGGRWVLAGALFAPGRRVYEEMANDVALTPSGDHAAVTAVAATVEGDEHAGAVYVYERTAAGWRFEREVSETGRAPQGHFGYTVAASDEDLAVGSDGLLGGFGRVEIVPRAFR